MSSQSSSETGGNVRERRKMRAVLFVLLTRILEMTKGMINKYEQDEKVQKFKIFFIQSGYTLTFDVLLKSDREAQHFLMDLLEKHRQLQSESSIEVSCLSYLFTSCSLSYLLYITSTLEFLQTSSINSPIKKNKTINISIQRPRKKKEKVL